MEVMRFMRLITFIRVIYSSLLFKGRSKLNSTPTILPENTQAHHYRKPSQTDFGVIP